MTWAHMKFTVLKSGTYCSADGGSAGCYLTWVEVVGSVQPLRINKTSILPGLVEC